VAFAILLYQFHRLKEMVVRTNRKLFGHRFMMDRIVPGGVTVDIDEQGISAILLEMDWLSKEFERLVVIYDENSSVEDRVRIRASSARKKRGTSHGGLRGPCSGLHLDCRMHNPFPPMTVSASRPRCWYPATFMHAHGSGSRRSGIPCGSSARS